MNIFSCNKPSKSKYKNTKLAVDGITFHSKKEAHRYIILRDLEAEGKIFHLETQKRIPIAFNGVHICYYIADFYYFDADSKEVLEDVKGFKTDVFKLKHKMLKALGIELTLI
jgi:hypothetical protein